MAGDRALYKHAWNVANRERMREYNRRWRRAHPEQLKATYVARRARYEAVKARPCADCGERFPPECMDFDHVRGEKLRKVSEVFDCSGKFLAEIAKCDLVCANCHRIRTRLRQQVRPHWKGFAA